MLPLVRRVVPTTVLRCALLVVLVILSGLARAQSASASGELLSAGEHHTCALRWSGAVDCWGRNDFEQATDHAGPYTQVSTGDLHTCALTPQGAADCWGDNSDGQATDQAGPYTQLSTGDDHTCALTPQGAADCWGLNTSGQATDQGGPYTHVSAGASHTCALTPQGAADCWGDNLAGRATDQAGPYTHLSVGDFHTCALTPARAADCWGDNAYEQATDQAGPYTHLSAGGFHTCALTPAGAADCWGINGGDGQAADQAGPYTEVSTGTRDTCALTVAGAADCWGYDASGQATDQAGPYGAYDPTPATASPTLSPLPNAAGWHRSDVTVAWNWQDNADGSGLEAASCPASSTSQGEGILTLRATCRDRAGNLATAEVTVKVDQTAPTLQPSVSPTPVILEEPATMAAGATDGLSGVAEQHCDALDTRTLGTKQVSCMATDGAGNTARGSATYTVLQRWAYLPLVQP